MLILHYIKQIDSKLPCVCSVIDHRWRQNVVRTKQWHTRRSHLLNRYQLTKPIRWRNASGFNFEYSWARGNDVLAVCCQTKMAEDVNNESPPSRVDERKIVVEFCQLQEKSRQLFNALRYCDFLSELRLSVNYLNTSPDSPETWAAKRACNLWSALFIVSLTLFSHRSH